MLIYNFQKEFIGIDEQDLKILGFKNLEELRAESADFADLFLKTPGFIHNFTHAHWIDFIVYDDSNKEFKAIIHVKDKDYKCNIEIKTIYLVDGPTKQAYLINLLNLRPLASDESEKLAKDIEQRPTLNTSSTKKALFQGQDLDKEPLTLTNIASNELLDEMNKEQEAEDEIYSEPDVQQEAESPEDVVSFDTIETLEEKNTFTKPEINDDFKIDLMIDDPVLETPTTIQAAKTVQTIKVEEKQIVKNAVKPENLYIYDPQVASDELGLPIDLIEEFLQDFIAQADDFKDKIYKYIEEEDINNVKSLSHKLKGVAANLRIVDAFEVLAIANTSDNLIEIQKNIDKFYQIMSKLSIHQPSDSVVEDSKPNEIAEKNIQDDDDYDENLFINIENEKPELPNKVEMPEQENSEVKINDTQYDKILIAKEIGIDNKFFNELFSDYMMDSITLVDSINEAIKSHKSDSWKKEAYTLKGMSDNMRVKQIIEDIDILINTDDTKIAQDAIDAISDVLKQISKI